MANEFSWRDYALPEAEEAAYYSAAPFGAGQTYGGKSMVSADNPWGASQFGAEGQQVQGGFAPAQQQYWSGRYGDVKKQYLGEVGRQLRANEQPTMSFVDYLEQYPWTQRYTSLGPSMRPGSSQSRFAPAARYMY